MRSVLVANTKGGCGKTTIATHLAAAFAVAGRRVALADADRQRSSLHWTERRPESAAGIAAVDWSKAIGKPPREADLFVIDAPAAMSKSEIEELVALADAIVLPVLPSVFDEGATELFLGRVEDLKRIRKAKTTIAVVGNRLKPQSRAAKRLETFLAGIGHAVAAHLRDSLIYPEVAAEGLTLFDVGGKRAQDFRADWAPLLAAVEAR